MRSRTSTTGPTSMSRHVSSRTSRTNAACSVSPISTAPPGRLHSPFDGSWPRFTSSTRSPSRITAPTATIGRSGWRLPSAITMPSALSPQPLALSPYLDADHFDHDALLALPIELRVEHLLPRPEIERAVRDRQDHLVTHDGALQVSIGVVLTRLVMPIVEARRGELLAPDLEVVDETVLPVVHVHAGGDVHRRHERGAFLHPAFLHDRRDLVGDAYELLPLLRVDLEVIGVN